MAVALEMSIAGYRNWETDTEPKEKDRRRLAELYQSWGDRIPDDYFIRFDGEQEESWQQRLEAQVDQAQEQVAEIAHRLEEIESLLSSSRDVEPPEPREPSPG